ncbi:M57 family metalloprotease [Nocardioides soli]|uniref:Matrixin family metalloprotease n=1 Tax=Nocardioides soli TaxID=1036020 RepID=A0A7W4Z325_9ACTN|nr:M57 family metalloprotease [Nocardioides soli]MBB3044477.1 hypothetical protein [Nocardioides soli]
MEVSNVSRTTGRGFRRWMFNPVGGLTQLGRMILVGGLVALALPLLVMSPAHANFGSAVGGPWLANNKSHRVDYYDTLTKTGNMTQWALNNQFPRFDFTWTYVDGSDYDVRIMDGEYGDTPAYGWTDCPSSATLGGTHPNRWCYGQVLRINYALAAAWDTTWGRRALACHELGHTVGLRHEDASDPSSSCMKTNTTPNNSLANTYSAEDVNQVLANY